jgi:glycosyltransferase involved in cell wall biosynthesis
MMKKNYTKLQNVFKGIAKSHESRLVSEKEVKGYFEGISQGVIRGWAFSLTAANITLEVELLLNGVAIASTKADSERKDVAEKFGRTDHKVGFEFDFNQQSQIASMGLGDRLDVCLKGDASFILPGSPVFVTEIVATDQMLGFFDGISKDGKLDGWAFNKTNPNKLTKVYFHLDNTLVDSITTSLYRADVASSTAKTDGKAGFSVVPQLTPETRALLKPGAKLDISFDALNQYPLPNSGLILTRSDAYNILLGIINTIGDERISSGQTDLLISLIDNFDDYLEGKDYQFTLEHAIFLKGKLALKQSLRSKEESKKGEIEEDESEEDETALLDKLKQDQLFDYDNLSITVVRTAHQLHQLGSYDKLLSFLTRIHNHRVLAFCQLECALFRVIALAATQALTESDIAQLDCYFFERSNNDGAKQHSIEFSSYIDKSIGHFYALLHTQVSPSLQQNSYSFLLGKVAFVLSRWLYRINANPRLALNFLSLLQITAADFFITPEVQNHAAHLCRELGDNSEALTHCLQSIEQTTDYWWAYHEAAVIMRVLCEHQPSLFRNAIERIYGYFHAAFRLNPYQSKSIRELKSALKQYLSISQKNTWQLAEAGFIAEALQERSYDLKVIAYAMSRCYAGEFHAIEDAYLPAPTRKLPGNKILFVGSRGLFQCYYYRVRQKLEQAKSFDLETEYLDLTEINSLNWQRLLMNVAVLYACRIPATTTEIELLAYAKGLGIPVIYDIDDLIFDAEHFPAPLESYAGTIDEKTHLHLTMDNPLFLTALKLADICVASTQPLAMEIAKQVEKQVPIKIHPNVLSYELYDLARISRHKPVLAANSASTVTIMYGSATKAHKQSFYEIFLPTVLKVLRKAPYAQLVLVGYFENIPAYLAQQIKIVEPTSSFLGYINLLQTADINIAILEQSPLTDTKSEIKWLEAAAFEIPSIVTPTQAYKDVLTDNENVLFAQTQAEWETQLLRLVEDATLREKIGVAAKKLAFEKFSPQIGERVLHDTLSPFVIHDEPTSNRKKRILLVNVYFYPQSVGGATRVFENQVRGLIERYPEAYEIYVLTTESDPDIGKPYYVEQYWFNDALVTRLNIPPQGWTEYEDEKVYKFCLEFFVDYQFDLIHFHSIQVLTASAVNAAVKLKIPYVITLHDAWWISVYQFLVNPEGQLVDHTSPLSGLCGHDLEEMDWIVTRWRELHNLLAKASLVVAVSEKFAQLYREAGVNTVQVHENYAEPFTPIQRLKQNPEQIVLGFVGGMSTHKGYDLFRKALEEGRFTNMKAVVVNHLLHSGEVHYSVWGNTPIEFCAKVKQSEVAQLYAQFDVLIAPSIWPESYGLVTREALQAGLWVIASDRGAIADCIIEGVNGNVVNVENHLGLMQALEKLPAQLANRTSAETEFTESKDTHLQRLVEIYQTALAN